jgi:hypothetical protein
MKHIKEYHSTAEDSGTEERQAKHFCQRVINSAMEIEAVQAAGVVCGIRSSGASDAIQYYSAWDVLRLARIASAGHVADIDFTHEDVDDRANDHDNLTHEESDANAMDNIAHEEDVDYNMAIVHPVAEDISQKRDEYGGVDDLLQTFHESGDQKCHGYAQVYTTAQGEKLPVSAAHHYMHRDDRLWRFSAYEFARLFNIRAMTKHDSKWYEKVVGIQMQDHVAAAGRPCDRFLLKAPHPLHTSHILVPRIKLGIPAFTGAPPPGDPSSSLMDCTADPAMMLKRRRFAEFFVSNFTPWSATRPPVLCYETWIDHVRVLEYEACLRRRREPDIPVGATYDERSAIEVARLSRLIAAGRLFDLDNIIGCFKTKRAAVVLLCKHRSRARTLWSQSGENKPNGFTAPADERRAAAAAIQKLLDKTARLRCPRDQASRQNDAAWASQFAKSLCGALPSSRGKKENGDASLRRLQSIWKQAAFPVRRSLQGGVHDPRKLSAALKQSLVMAESDASGIISSSVDTYITRHAMIANTICADPFADIDDPAYERAVEAHNSAGLRAKDAPLNPEQRAAGRNFVKFALLMKQSREQGWTQQDITNNASRLGLKQITMMTGAGGTGKSKVVHAIQREFQRLGLGRLLVTAYTGVAAAPFGGPTLLTLLNLNVHTKSKRHLQGGDAEYRARIRKKFEDECGAPIEEFGGVVIDEISFIDATVFGHVDNGFNILLGKKSFGETLCGGMPLLLSGDNHQKPPPGGTPWHQHLVKVATKEFDNPGRHASDNALKRGLNLLRKAQSIDFKRQMRARNDPAFIDFQMKMRRTDVVHPIPDMFLQQMRTVSKHDLEEDAAWLFAPIGVLSHVERDAINLGQLKAFAAKFNLPIVR